MHTANESIRRASGRTARFRGMLAAALVAVGAALGACTRDTVGPGRAVTGGPSFTLNPACDSAVSGQTHDDSVTTAETWTRANSPHRVDAHIHIEGSGVLTLEPGTVLCFLAAAGLFADHGGRLVADGRDTARIVLTANDPAGGWGGVHLSGTPASPSSLRNLRLEHTDGATALSTHDYHAAIIDSTVFRQNELGLYLWGRGSRMSRSRVDTVTSSTGPAVTLGNIITFEQNTIRGAAGVGLAVLGTNGIHLLGGRIEGSGGVGLRVTTMGWGFLSTAPVRVTGGATYPAELVVSAFPRIYSTVAHQDSLLGNARDTLVVTGGTMQQFAYPSPALPWHVTADIIVQHYGILAPQPGASLFFDTFVRLTATNGGRVVARGTAAAPVVFDGSAWGGITVEGVPALSSYLTNVRIEHALGIGILAAGNHTVVIDSAVFRQNGSAAWLWSVNSRMSRSRVDSTWGSSPAVFLSGYNSALESTLIRGSAGVGLGVATSTAHVLSCEVRDGAADGIYLWDSVEVHNCNLVNNAGVGISVDNAVSLANVEDNWWGDAAGPTGTNGDGVSGPGDYTPWRTTPYVLPYVP